MNVSVDGVAVTVTTAVPLHAASANSANPSGTASSFGHGPHILPAAENLRMKSILQRFRVREKR
jgi:hypothetical protein